MQAERRTPLTVEQPAPTAALHRLMAVVAAVWLVIDQATKQWALSALTPGDPAPLLGSVLQLNLIRNAGAAFSLGDGATWILTILAVGVCAWVISFARRLGSRAWALTLGSLLGGAVGNLVDRFVREPGPGRGHVVDFIDYNGLFIGNVADIAIVGAACVIAWLALKGVPVEGGSAVGESGIPADDAGRDGSDLSDPDTTDTLSGEKPRHDEPPDDEAQDDDIPSDDMQEGGIRGDTQDEPAPETGRGGDTRG